MKNKNGIYIIGVDHGYGNIKTANCCFPTGVESSDTEPTFKNDLLIYQGRYYQIGVGHKEYAAEKIMDEDYYILTLAAIARELSREHITQANVFLAAGLPLSWVVKQRKAFQAYLLQNREVELSFRRKDYRIRVVGAAVYPQGFAAIAPIVNYFIGSNKLIDFVKGHNHIAGLRYGRPGLFLLGLRRCGLFGCGDRLGGLRGNILRRASIQFFIGHLRSSFSLKLHKFER